MLKRISILAIFFSGLILIVAPKESNAFGIGIFVPVYGTGSGTYTLSNFDTQTDYDFDYAGGLGIVLDTRVARNGLFNYRLNLGFYSASQSYSTDEYNTSYDGFKFYIMDHTFGFGIVKTRFMRLWVGPQLRISYMNYELTDTFGTESQYGLGYGLAPVLGANFNFGSVFTVAVDMGYRFGSYAGSWEYDGSYYDSSDFTRSENQFFLNLSLIFRIGDSYEADLDEKSKVESSDDFYY